MGGSQCRKTRTGPFFLEIGISVKAYAALIGNCRLSEVRRLLFAIAVHHVNVLFSALLLY
jgi:hypothetical protein